MSTATTTHRDPTPTEVAIMEQLTANTGRHMLDSGGAYGRNFERNQGRDFMSEPGITLSVKHGYLAIEQTVLSFLTDVVDYQADGDDAFRRWSEAEVGGTEVTRFEHPEMLKRADCPWLVNAEEFCTLIGAGGLYGDGPPMTVNTYNGESVLEQILQYVYFELADDVYLETTEVEGGIDIAVVGSDREDDENVVSLPAGSYVLLQVHGGCDARGGYTRPYLYYVGGNDSTDIMDNARAEMSCGEHHFSTDDAGYTWEGHEGGHYGGYASDDFVFLDDGQPVPTEPDGKFYADQSNDVLHCRDCLKPMQAYPYPH